MALKPIGRTEPDYHVTAVRFARIIGAVIAAIGLGILAGWHLETPLIKEGVPSSLTITPNSAAGLLICGLGLLALTHWISRPAARGLGVFLAIVAGSILSHEITGERLPIDHALYDLLTAGGGGTSPNISPGAKIAFVLLGTVMVLTARKALLFKIIVEFLLAATLTLSITNLIGHSYEVTQRYNPFPFTEMPIHMGIMLAFLVAGFSAACPDRGFARAVLDTSAGGQMIRRLLPGIVIIPILLGWAVHFGIVSDLFNSTVGLAAFAVLTILIMAGFSWVTSIALKKADADRDTALVELHNQRESLRTTLVSIADAVIVVDPKGHVMLMNPVAESVTGWLQPETGAHLISEVFPVKDEVSGVLMNDPSLQAMADKDIVGLQEGLLARKDETSVPIEYISSPVLNSNAKVEGAVLIFRDISERRQAEDQMNMLVRELNHRVRNVLMIVQSIVQASTEHTSGKSAEDMARVLLDRLRSLGRAHELLLDTHWTGANLKKMVEQELEPFRAHNPEKVQLQGKNVFLPPQCTSVVAMVLHELATNAAKYGALSLEKGRLKVNWSQRGSKLTIKWAESNIKVPEERTSGFGTSLIDRGIRENLRGETKLDYTGNGLTVTLRIPLPKQD